MGGKLKHKNKAINNELHPIMLNAYNYFYFLKNEQKKRKEIFPQTHKACWQASEVQKHLALCNHYYNILKLSLSNDFNKFFKNFLHLTLLQINSLNYQYAPHMLLIKRNCLQSLFIFSLFDEGNI